MKPQQAHQNGGFTLVEIMVVVALIGLLAGLAFPAYSQARSDSQVTVFINDLRVFAGAAEVYMLDTGRYLEDASTGTVPTGWDAYIHTGKWTDLTPLGGAWDVELDSHGIKAGLGVVFTAATMPAMATLLEIDQRFDDGDLTTGAFRQIAPHRFYYILEEA